MPRHPRVSPTTASLTERVFSTLAQKAQARGGTIYPLHVGDTWREPPAAARAEAQRTTDHPRLHNYAPVQGEPALLDAIAKKLEARSGVTVTREHIQVTAGATSGLSVVCGALFDPGDEVLLPAPYWPLVRGIIAGRGAVPVEVPFFDRAIGSGEEAEAALEAAVTERTVALYVNTPHNPTSRVLSADVVDAMARVARRHDLWVIADEAYEELWLGDAPAPAVWARDDLRDRTVAAHTLSKSHGLAGARIGWVHGPAEAMAAVRGLQTFHTYCAPRPMQVGAVAALEQGEPWLAEARRLYGEAGRRAAEALGLPPPAGGTFLFFDASPMLDASDATAMPFLERCLEAGVLLTPGGACGRDYARWVRLCFTSVPPDALGEALDRLRPLFAR